MCDKFDRTSASLCSDLYQQIISVLGYKDNPSFKSDESGIYDALYYVKIDCDEYPVVGVKCFAELNETALLKQHLLYWNRNDVPISILVFPDEMRIYNNFTSQKGKALLYSSKTDKDDSYLDNFKADRIATKVVWNRLEKLSKSNDRVDKQLLSSLKNAVLQANIEYGMPLTNAYNFMSLCIFIKYLEDRKMLTASAFIRWGIDTFSNFLESATAEDLFAFFRTLKERFNGDLFVISKEQLPSKNQLEVFACFFKGAEILDCGSQLRLFPYDFSVIPIGLISNIYETFLSLDDEAGREKTIERTGTFYTPHYLSDFIVQQCFLPYEGTEKTPTVLDPACGSGVFLVDSLRAQIKLLKREQKKIDATMLSTLLQNNIYGVDINPNALRITCFSLYIALLEELSPRDIMENNFSFPCLIGRNLIAGSFFSDCIEQAQFPKSFDIVVGNPPWKSLPNSDHMAYCKKRNIPISDAQIAQAFMCRTSDFANEKTQVYFLLTNSIFTNKYSKKFLRYFLEKYCISEIVNLEAIKGQLFAHAQYPCSIVSYRCISRENYTISYQPFRSNGIFRLLHKFICDKNDAIRLSKRKLLNQDYIWTILIYGDEFDVECVETMLDYPPLSMCIEGKLDFRQGYITSRDGVALPEFNSYRGGSLKYTFAPYGIDYNNVPMMSSMTLYDRPRSLDMYTCPHKLLIKRTYNERSWGAAYIQEPLIFSNDFSTFNDYSGDNIDLIRYLEGVINSTTFLYYGFYMSKIKAAKKPEVVKEDIMRFPLPAFDKSNSDVLEIINLVSDMENLVHREWEMKNKKLFPTITDEKGMLQDKINKCVYNLYKFDDFQISVIHEGLGRFHIHEETFFANSDDFEIYAKCLCEYFNHYTDKSFPNSWKAKITSGQLYTTIYFSFSGWLEDTNPDVWGMSGLDQINDQLLVQRRIVMFVNDGFQVIQSNSKENWTVGKAKKMAAKITQEIMCEGE